MLLSSLCFSEEICQLQFGRHILKINCFLMTMRPSKGSINTDILCKLMFHGIIGNLYSSSIVTKKRSGSITRDAKISQQPPKPYNPRSSGGKCAKFSLCTGPRDSCLLLGLPCKRRRTKKYAITGYRAAIGGITCPSGIRVSIQSKRAITSIKQALRCGPP